MSDLQELKNELMKDPEFKKEYESLQPEMDITRAILDARIQAGLTQIQLSEKSGISQADISRFLAFETFGGGDGRNASY